MLSDKEKEYLTAAMLALKSGRDSPAHVAVALSRLSDAGTDVLVDFSTNDILGGPVIVANRQGQRPPPALSPRQQEVFVLLRTGASNKEIARRLGISVSTAKDHVHAILTRLGLERRAQVAAGHHVSEDTL